ncbi:MAG: putative lipoprotein YmbA, partial [Gammaproteobacteria bacterium]
MGGGSLRGGLVVAVVAGFLASCANTTPSRYYILAPVIQPVSPVQLVQHAQGPLVRVGPISVPPYLDRPNIVTRRGANGIELAQLDSWAEPLKDNITRVLVDNLSALSPGRRIVA